MRQKLFRVLGFNAIFIVLIVVLAEAVFGTWFGDSFGALNIPRETIRFDASDLYDGGGEVVYRRDKYGLRGRYKSPSGIDILTIGGSTTDQRAITEGETWQDVLAAAFKSEGRDISVVNAGIDGQSTVGNLYSFERWFPLNPGLRPGYAMVYVGINDVHVWMEDTADRLRAHSRWLRIHHAIKNNSALYRLYRMAKGTLVARKAKLTGDDFSYKDAKWTDAPTCRSSAASKIKPGLSKFGCGNWFAKSRASAPSPF